MTNREYLSTVLSKFNITDAEIDVIMLNQSIEPSEDVNDVRSLKIAVYNEFSNILPVANVSEGGFSLSWNFEAVKKWYSLLANELGLEDVLNDAQNSVSDASYIM